MKSCVSRTFLCFKPSDKPVTLLKKIVLSPHSFVYFAMFAG
nr:MAG TPA: hypothetical protein [Caudoviricetes sp.]